MKDDSELTLITGATGYIGGRLAKALEADGVALRFLARRPSDLEAHVGRDRIVRGDVLDKTSLVEALKGVDIAYYLIHSMGSKSGFVEADRQGAINFAEAARSNGVKRIIYLGGLSDSTQDLSPHLKSRQEVGEILTQSGAQVIELRASIVIGSGSLSFEMIRALVERLPMMVTPRWVSCLAQPIAVEDVIAYLVQARTIDLEGSRIFEIGGPDQVTYGDLMREYGRQRGLKRFMIPVPFLTPWLSSLWLGLVTPIYARIGRKLIDSIRNPSVVRDDAALKTFSVKPLGVRDAVARAMLNEDREFAQTRWSDSLSAGNTLPALSGVRFGNRLVDSRAIEVNVPPSQAFAPIRRIGGSRGWYAYNSLWRLRGFLDLLVGGVGMRRGRRDPEDLKRGDVVDWCRVEEIEADRRLRFLAEMRLPGRAWLEFEVDKTERGSIIRQTAIFDPAGLSGLVYWYLISPLHSLVFRGMLNGIARAAKSAKQ